MEYLRDAQGHVIGRVSKDETGEQSLFDANGHFLGRYNPGTNMTVESHGHTVGYGNVLASLLPEQKPKRSW